MQERSGLINKEKKVIFSYEKILEPGQFQCLYETSAVKPGCVFIDRVPSATLRLLDFDSDSGKGK